MKFFLRRRIKNKILKETIWSFLTKGITFILFLLTNVYLARVLGVQGFGEWSYLLSIITIFLTLSYFGINTSTKVFIARNNKTNNLKSIFRDSLLLRTKVSIISAIIFLTIAFPLSRIMNKPEFFVLFLFATPFILFKSFVEFNKNVFQGLHRLKFQFFINFSEFGLNLILSIILLKLILSINSVLYAFIISSIITSILGFLFFGKTYRSLKGNIKEDYQKKIFNYSIPLVLIGVGFILMTEIDTIMLGLLLGELEVGVYAVAKNLINKLPQIAFAISLGVMPIFAKMSLENKSEMKNKFKKLLLINSLIYIPLTLVLIFLSPWIIIFLFGIEYTASILPLQILSIWVLMVSYNIFQSSFMDYQKKAWKRTKNFSIAIILNIILNIILIPRYGPVGAALGTTISYIPYFIANWIEVRKSWN